MDFNERRIGIFSLRIWLCIVLLAGSYMVIDGIFSYLRSGDSLLEAVLGGVLCIFSIIAAAIPHNMNSKTEKI